MKGDITRHRFDDGAHAFDYTVHRKPRLKHRYIRIRDGAVVVTARRGTPLETLHTFVAQHTRWITQQLAQNSRHSLDLTQPGTTILYRGQSYPVEIDTDASRNQLTLTDQTARFTLADPPSHPLLLSLLERYYKDHAPQWILPRVAHWSDVMDLYPARVTFRRARTRWGSCSARDTLSLNIYLMMLPDHLIDYVVVHELAHIRHKNHGKDFWHLVGKYLPSWEKQRKSIRKYEKYLA